MGRRNPQQPAIAEITGFTKKGNGLGIVSDETQRCVEVPFTMPGDRVQVLMQRKRNGIHASRLEEVIVPSSNRIEPRCMHFGVCGGCRWQHIPYQEQLLIKQEEIEKLFRPLANPGAFFGHIVPCDPPWQYRNKMEFSFSSDAAGKQFVGLVLDASRGKVLNLVECHLVNPWFVDALRSVRQWWQESGLLAYHPHSNKGSLRTLTVREGMRTGDRLVMLTVSGNPDFALNKQQLTAFTAFMRDACEPLVAGGQLSIFLRIQQTAKGVATNFFEIHLHGPSEIREILHIKPSTTGETARLEFSVSPSAFFQPNTKQAEQLYSLAFQLLDITPDSVIYDLYCGAGALGICAARTARQVLGVEISPESSLDARANAARNGLTNVTIVTGAVRDVIDKVRGEKSFPMPDIVMVDPPRAGLDAETLGHLIELRPRKILYISCNPSTQAENVKVLMQAGYQIQALQPVDQFPHTAHIENIVVLT